MLNDEVLAPYSENLEIKTDDQRISEVHSWLTQYTKAGIMCLSHNAKGPSSIHSGPISLSQLLSDLYSL